MTERQAALQPGSGQALNRIIGELQNTLVYMKECGCTGFDASPETLEKMAQLGAVFHRKKVAAGPPVRGKGRTYPAGTKKHPQRLQRPQTGPQSRAAQPQNFRQPVPQAPVAPPQRKPQPPRASGFSQGKTLDMIRTELVGDCRRCRLCLERRSIVFGEGNPNARLMFVGDGPRQDEDKAGRFYAGAAGDLLLKIIKAIGMTPEDIYISSVVKCRLPNAQLPQPDEIHTCFPFLQRQMNTVKPQFVCALGKVAAQALLSTNAPITELRGRYYNLRGMIVVPTYHPAYLVKKTERKREAWEDLKMLMQQMNKSG